MNNNKSEEKPKVGKLPPISFNKKKERKDAFEIIRNEKIMIVNKKIANYKIEEVIEEEKIGESVDSLKVKDSISVEYSFEEYI